MDPPPVTDLSGYLKTVDADLKYALINHTHTTAQITGLDTSIQSINTEISNLKSSVSSGKATIAAAVTDKGVQTAADATFEQMAINIAAIMSSPNYVTGTVKINSSNTDEVTIPDLIGKDNFIFGLETLRYSAPDSSDPVGTICVYIINNITGVMNGDISAQGSGKLTFNKETGTLTMTRLGGGFVNFMYFNDTYPSTFRYFGW